MAICISFKSLLNDGKSMGIDIQLKMFHLLLILMHQTNNKMVHILSILMLLPYQRKTDEIHNFLVSNL